MSSFINLPDVLGSVLRGKIDGRKHFGLICAAASGIPQGSIVRLDFSGIDDLSASWIAAAILPLVDWSASPENDLYPILTGVIGSGKKWEDEFELVATKANVIFLAEGHDENEQGVLLGTLEPILIDTLKLVQHHGEVTGAGLKRLVPNENIGATAWSNRLRDLHSMRLLRRSTRGREQIYSSVLEVNLNGTSSPRFTNRNVPTTDAASGSSGENENAV